MCRSSLIQSGSVIVLVLMLLLALSNSNRGLRGFHRCNQQTTDQPSGSGIQGSGFRFALLCFSYSKHRSKRSTLNVQHPMKRQRHARGIKTFSRSEMKSEKTNLNLKLKTFSACELRSSTYHSPITIHSPQSARVV